MATEDSNITEGTSGTSRKLQCDLEVIPAKDNSGLARVELKTTNMPPSHARHMAEHVADALDEFVQCLQESGLAHGVKRMRGFVDDNGDKVMTDIEELNLSDSEPIDPKKVN